MLPTFVIGLREGVEAALIVGIIAAFLIQRGERRAIRSMWLGVAIAIALCVGVAVVLSVIGENLPFKQRESMEGVLALIAVAGVTYMIVWMRRHSRELKGVARGERRRRAGGRLIPRADRHGVLRRDPRRDWRRPSSCSRPSRTPATRWRPAWAP